MYAVGCVLTPPALAALPVPNTVTRDQIRRRRRTKLAAKSVRTSFGVELMHRGKTDELLGPTCRI
jgi:hypothetical protein